MPKPNLSCFKKRAAEAACENAHLVAQDLVERVRELLFDMPAPGGLRSWPKHLRK